MDDDRHVLFTRRGSRAIVRSRLWRGTDYPRECPECGEETRVRWPAKAQGGRWGKAHVFLNVVNGVWFLFIIRPTLASRAFAILIPVAVVALWLIFRRAGGERFWRDGFVRCPGCGWIRSGGEEGAEVERTRYRGERVFSRISLMFAVPSVWFFALCFFSRDAALWLLVLVFAGSPALIMRSVFRPQRPPRHLRSPVLDRILRHAVPAGTDAPARAGPPDRASSGRNGRNGGNGVPE